MSKWRETIKDKCDKCQAIEDVPMTNYVEDDEAYEWECGACGYANPRTLNTLKPVS